MGTAYIVIHETLPPMHEVYHDDPSTVPQQVREYVTKSPLEMDARGQHDFFHSGYQVGAWSMSFDTCNTIRLYSLDLDREYVLHARMDVVCPHFTSKDADCVIHMRRAIDAGATTSFLGCAIDKLRDTTNGCFDKYVLFWQAWSVPLPDDLRRHVFGVL